MDLLASTAGTIAAWVAAAVVLLLVAAVLWSFLRRKGTVDGLVVESPADAVRRARLAEATVDPDAARPVEAVADETEPRLPEQGA
ncbi:MAG TPA: hypothetical protein VFL59_02640 [Candidatus Nanopelagicales bacterium]|nr:hypothetical protein [Candidatus Nanopelagicales bacterium]